jgi:hypothetical protein
MLFFRWSNSKGKKQMFSLLKTCTLERSFLPKENQGNQLILGMAPIQKEVNKFQVKQS